MAPRLTAAGLTFPEDYGPISGFQWMDGDVLLVALSNGYITNVDFGSMVRMRQPSLCYAVLCDDVLCYAVLCCAVLCCAVLCFAVLCCAVLCYAMLC